MEQTFLQYVLTDPRFSMASSGAILRSLLVPVLCLSAGFALIGAPSAAYLALAVAAVVWAGVEWLFLVVRMARRIALGQENPTAMASLPVMAMSRYLHRSYF